MFERESDEREGFERVDLLCYAVVHLCRAGSPRTAFTRIYQGKIMAGANQAALRALGRFSAIAAATAALDDAVAATPDEELTISQRITALGHRGTCVMALYGHTVDELAEILLRIDDLARQIDAHLERAYANWMLHSYYLVTGRLAKTERSRTAWPGRR